ncbi:MAG: hypothetical protein KY452_05675 [Actinobacteria bacterium]|nr:hypothetical protein [Actinomycetota bacterium]
MRWLLGGRPWPGLEHERVSSFLAANPVLWVDLPGRPQQRREPGELIPWWWLGPDRVALAAGAGLVVATQPERTLGHLTLESCTKVAFIGMAGPSPGAVRLSRQATVTFTADNVHGVPGTPPARPRHARPEPALASLVGRQVTLEAEGQPRPGRPQLVARGVVAEAGVLEHHVVVCLHDGTLAVVHCPAQVDADAGRIVFAGEFERVVLDVPHQQSVGVARPGRLVITPEDR